MCVLAQPTALLYTHSHINVCPPFMFKTCLPKYYPIIAQIKTPHCPLKVCYLLTSFWSSLLQVFLLFISEGTW